MSRKTFTLDRTVRLVIGIAVVIGVFFLVQKLSGVLFPFLVGWLIAYLIYPLVRFVQDKMRFKFRSLSILFTLAVIVGVISGAVYLVKPMMIHEFERMTVLLSEYATQLANQNFLSEETQAKITQYLLGIDIRQLFQSGNVQTLLDKLLPQFWSLLSNTWQIVVSTLVVFMIVLYVIFILRDYEKINDGFVALFPRKYQRFVNRIFGDLKSNMNRYFRGQALVSLIVGILYCIGLQIVGIPMAITMGIFIGFLHMIPYMQAIGFIPITVLALLKSVETGSSFWAMIIGVGVVFLIIQALIDLFLVPKIMGKAMGLNPAVILLSLSVWGALLGIVGMIIALPMTTLMLSYYNIYLKSIDNSLPEIEQ